jgi:hypothetical protein
MSHREKSFQPHFSRQQAAACSLRQRIAQGLVQGERAVADACAVLYDGDYTASTLAAELLGLSGSSAAIAPLVETVLHADAAEAFACRRLRITAIAALVRLAPDDDMAVGAFIAASRDPDQQVAIAAIGALAQTREQVRRALLAVAPCVHHAVPAVRRAAQRALAELGRRSLPPEAAVSHGHGYAARLVALPVADLRAPGL